MELEINDNHTCVFCGHNQPHKCQVHCDDEEGGHKYDPPPMSNVMLGQIHEGQAIVTIHDDVTGDEIALLMSAFMDRVSRFEHIKRDPSKIMKALMGGMQPQ